MAVLLIEDDDDLRAMMAEILLDQGHRVTAVSNLDDARKYLAAFLPTLIVLDGSLQGKSTRTLLLEMELRAPRPRPPVLLVSGSWGSGELAEEFSLPFLSKPFSIARFLELVQRLARNSGSGARPIVPALASAPAAAVAAAGNRRG